MFSRRFAPFLLFFPALLLFWQLSYAPFWNPDEGRYAAASYEMAFPFDGGASDWVVPRLNTITRLNKPPLVYWLAGGSFRIFGAHEWSGRLVPTLAALGVLLVLYFWGQAAFNRKTGIAAALVWATSLFPFAMARVLNTDMLLCFSVTLALYGLWGLLETPSRWPIVWAGIGMGLALLAKGPVGIALPLGIALVYGLATRKSREPFSWPALGMALVLAVAIGLPWYLAVQARRPDFLRTFILEENLGRFSGGQEFHKKSPVWYYLPVALAGLFPWTGLCLTAFSGWAQTDKEKRARWFFWLWAGLIIGFFSLSGTKLVSYILPAFPALAMLAGAALARWETLGRNTRGLAIGVSVVAFLAVGLAIARVPKFNKTTKNWTWQPGVLLDDKAVPRAVGEPFVWQLGGALFLSSLGLLWAAKRGKAREILAVQGVAAGALYLIVAPLAGTIARYEDGSAPFAVLRNRLQPADQIVALQTFVPAGIVYAGQPLTHFKFKNTSGLAPLELEKSPFFPKDRPRVLETMLGQPRRIFVLTRGFPRDSLQAALHLWGRNNDFFLWSNRPKPADFSFDFVAPRRRNSPTVPGVKKNGE